MSNAEPLTAIEDNLTSAQAELAKLHLDEAGIPAYLEGENANAMLGMVEQVRLMVPSRLAEEAVRALASRRKQAGDAGVCLACGQAMSDDQNRCSACGWSFEDGGE